jgi:hypothetical protein
MLGEGLNISNLLEELQGFDPELEVTVVLGEIDEDEVYDEGDVCQIVGISVMYSRLQIEVQLEGD